MKKFISIFLCVVILAGFLSSCSEKAVTPLSPVGIFVYEDKGCGSDFYIEIREDGTFSYSTGLLASYFGYGEWTLDGDVLCLKDREYPSMKFVNYFKVKEKKLVFIENDSTNFMYVKVADGDDFNKSDKIPPIKPYGA